MIVPMSEIPTAAIEAATAAIIAEVDERLQFNLAAYGRAWNGETGDTEFIVGESAKKALEAALPHLAETAAPKL